MSNIPVWERYLGVPLLKVHDAIYRKTNGRIGHKMPGQAPILLLHTVGAKTGIARTHSLSYALDGGAYHVVASKGGDPKAPGWYFNLKANPNGPDDADYARLWKLVNDNNSDRYDGYQRRTSRPIPIVALTP